jgi:hypothetical protein
MANHNGFFGRKDSLWGGETLKSTNTDARIFIETDDRFRVERGPNSKLTLIPHPKNKGLWKKAHNKANPVILRPFRTRRYKRVFSMSVTIKEPRKPIAAMKFFLVERRNGTVAIVEKVKGAGHDGGMASVER